MIAVAISEIGGMASHYPVGLDRRLAGAIGPPVGDRFLAKLGSTSHQPKIA
jgi:hypothetical protein